MRSAPDLQPAMTKIQTLKGWIKGLATANVDELVAYELKAKVTTP